MDELERVNKRFATSQALMNQIRYAAESLSLDFDRWTSRTSPDPASTC